MWRYGKNYVRTAMSQTHYKNLAKLQQCHKATAILQIHITNLINIYITKLWCIDQKKKKKKAINVFSSDIKYETFVKRSTRTVHFIKFVIYAK